MTIRMIIVILISLYTTRVVLNVLGVAEYGIYNVVAGFVIMFGFLNSSLSSAVQRFYNVALATNGEKGARMVYCASFKIHLILAAIILIIVEIGGNWYIPNKMVLPQGQLPTAMWLFQFSILALFCNILYTPYMAAIMAHEKMTYYATVEIFNNILKLGMAFALPYLPGNKLIWYGIYNLLIALLVLILYLIYSVKKFPEIRLGATPSKKIYKEILAFSGWGVTGAFAYTLREQGINLILNFFFGTVINAARAITNQINGAFSGFTSNLFIASRPQIIQSYSKGDYKRAWGLTFTLSKVMSLVFFIIALPICININFILHIWLSNEVPQFTNIFTILLTITTLISCFLSPISTIMHATGIMRFYSISSTISNLFTVPLAYIFILYFKIPYLAYIALLITMITNLLAALISANKYANLKIYSFFKFVILPIITISIICIPPSLFISYLLPENWIGFMLSVFFCLGVSCVAGYLCVLGTQERIRVNYALKKIGERIGFQTF